MKLKEYIENLQKLAKEKPETLEMDVIYARDDEGNGYQGIYYEPTLGVFDEEGEFHSEANIKEDAEYYEEYEIDVSTINAVCIN
jgi:hypothetical protein